MRYTRRQIGQLALGSLPAVALLSHTVRVAGQTTRPRPNSKVAGVQIGLNVPYSFGNNNMPGDEVLDRCLELGVSAVEIRSQPVERAMGWVAPAPARGQGAAQASAHANVNASVHGNLGQGAAALPETTTWIGTGTLLAIAGAALARARRRNMA